MQLLTIQEIQTIAGGDKNYNLNLNIDVPLSMMPYIATQFESTKAGNQFSDLVTALTNAGFDVNQVKVMVSYNSYEYSTTNNYLLAK